MSTSQKATRELTKDLIIQQARSLFIDKGYHNVSMRSIARKMGYSHGALYYHFKNKAALFFTIIEVDFSKLNERLEETLQGPEEDQIKLYNIFLRFIEFGLNHQSQYDIMFVVRNTEVDGLAQNIAHRSYEKFAQAVQSLSAVKLTVSEVWSAFIAVHGFVAHYRGYVENFEEAQGAAKSHVNFILKGLYG